MTGRPWFVSAAFTGPSFGAFGAEAGALSCETVATSPFDMFQDSYADVLR
jgi:hypothetical protein